jgi:hypothetical protein
LYQNGGGFNVQILRLDPEQIAAENMAEKLERPVYSSSRESSATVRVNRVLFFANLPRNAGGRIRRRTFNQI